MKEIPLSVRANVLQAVQFGRTGIKRVDLDVLHDYFLKSRIYSTILRLVVPQYKKPYLYSPISDPLCVVMNAYLLWHVKKVHPRGEKTRFGTLSQMPRKKGCISSTFLNGDIYFSIFYQSTFEIKVHQLRQSYFVNMQNYDGRGI